MSEIEFIDGLIVKEPRNGAPDFVKGSLSIKRADLIAWLQDRNEDWLNADIKVAKSGKWYIAVNDWKPEGKPESSGKRGEAGMPAPPGNDPFDEDLPF